MTWNVDRRLSCRVTGSSSRAAITAALGIWLTTRRLLICWPITARLDFSLHGGFFSRAALSDALLQVFFVAFTLYGWWHWWRGVRAGRRGARGPAAAASLVSLLPSACAGSFVLGCAGRAPRRRAAASRRRADASYSPRGQLVAGAQAHRQLVALDRRRR